MATVWLFLVTGHLGEDAVRSVEEDCAPLCVAVDKPQPPAFALRFAQVVQECWVSLA